MICKYHIQQHWFGINPWFPSLALKYECLFCPSFCLYIWLSVCQIRPSVCIYFIALCVCPCKSVDNHLYQSFVCTYRIYIVCWRRAAIGPWTVNIFAIDNPFLCCGSPYPLLLLSLFLWRVRVFIFCVCNFYKEFFFFWLWFFF